MNLIKIIYKMSDQLIIIKKKFIYKRFNFKKVSLGNVDIVGDSVEIGKGTYFNGGRISSCPEAKIKIGVLCAIGFNVSIMSSTHDPYNSTGLVHLRNVIYKPVVIGDGVWIGNNVVILPGVTVGDFCVIGANSVVNSDVPDFAVYGGAPAKLLYMKDKNKCKKHVDYVGWFKKREF
jgi:acetyltransferase-like isoleucine patch superfamily enzyme